MTPYHVKEAFKRLKNYLSEAYSWIFKLFNCFIPTLVDVSK